MIKELLNKLVDEKLDMKSYEKMAEETNDMDLKQLLMNLSEQEKEHYKMIRDYIATKYEN